LKVKENGIQSDNTNGDDYNKIVIMDEQRSSYGNDIYSTKTLSNIRKLIDGIFEVFPQYKIEEFKYLYKLNKYYDGFDGCIYFIRDNTRNLIKIGYTQDLNKRVNDFNKHYEFCGLESDFSIIACFLTLKDHIKESEKFFHDLFQKFHYRYEWFDINNSELLIMLYRTIFESHGVMNNVNETLYFTFDILKKFKEFDPMSKYNPRSFNVNENLISNRIDVYYKNRTKYLRNEHLLYDVYIFILGYCFQNGINIEFENFQLQLQNSLISYFNKRNIFEYYLSERKINRCFLI